MCCITELPSSAGGPTIRLSAHHRKSASMDSFFLSTAISKELGKELLSTSSPSSSASSSAGTGAEAAHIFASSSRPRRVAPPPPGVSPADEAAGRAAAESRFPRPEPLRRRAKTEDVRDDEHSSAHAEAKAKAVPRRRKKQQKVKKSVRFSTIQIREHALIIGDNPSCNTGLPISLGWEHVPGSPLLFGVDAYERSRENGGRKSCNKNEAATELQLSRRRRMELLTDVGGYHWKELVREERKLRMRERDEFFGRIPSSSSSAGTPGEGVTVRS